ncbi:hypothetical protein ACVWXO_004537 [Bradyrhizobium sp. LM2.7]
MLVPYAERSVEARTAEIEVMLTMAPPLPSRINGTAALVQRNGPVRLTSSTRRQSASCVSISGANTAIPALLTSASSRPNRRSIVLIAGADRGHVRDVASQRQRRLALVDLGDRAAEQFALDIEQRHPPALGQKFFRGRKPDAARGSGDEGDVLRGLRHFADLSWFREVDCARALAPFTSTSLWL